MDSKAQKVSIKRSLNLATQIQAECCTKAQKDKKKENFKRKKVIIIRDYEIKSRNYVLKCRNNEIKSRNHEI